MKKIKFPVQESIGIIAGSIAAGFVTKMVNDKLPSVPGFVKALIPAGAGLFLAGQKNVIVKNAGLGMIATAGANLAKTLVPGIGANMDELLSAPADQSILSIPMGDPADQSIISAAGDEPLLMSPEEIAAADEFAMNGEEAMLMGAEDFNN